MTKKEQIKLSEVIENKLTAYNTKANLWRAEYFKLRKELVASNKGLRRLRRKLNKLTNKDNQADHSQRGYLNWHCPENQASNGDLLKP